MSEPAGQAELKAAEHTMFINNQQITNYLAGLAEVESGGPVKVIGFTVVAGDIMVYYDSVPTEGAFTLDLGA